jgi:uncharacterized protein
MGPDVVRASTERIAQHAVRHGLTSVDVVLHGGEPLLFGAEGIDAVATQLRRAVPDGIGVELRMQTNGLRLDGDMLRVLARHGIRVGVSIDGDRAQHDRHRRTPDGRGSWDAAAAAVRLLHARHPELYAGILATVDLRNDPLVTYESLIELSPPVLDLLLPLATWSAPPPGVPDPGDPHRATPYGDWLAAVFDRWYPVAAKETGIRFYEELIQLVLGGRSRVETLGLSPAAVVVIDTDGAVEQVDTLRVAYDGAAAAGLDVRHDDLDAALAHPGVVARQLGADALCGTCRDCPVHRICGAGYYPHRYRPGSGFRNPSVYCHDLRRIIEHVADRLAADVARWRDRVERPVTAS